MKNLLRFLSQNNIRVINPVAKSFSDKTCVGIFCGAPSLLRKSHSLKITTEFLSSSGLPYKVEDNSPMTNQFKINL